MRKWIECRWIETEANILAVMLQLANTIKLTEEERRRTSFHLIFPSGVTSKYDYLSFDNLFIYFFISSNIVNISKCCSLFSNKIKELFLVNLEAIRTLLLHQFIDNNAAYLGNLLRIILQPLALFLLLPPTEGKRYFRTNNLLQVRLQQLFQRWAWNRVR